MKVFKLAFLFFAIDLTYGLDSEKKSEPTFLTAFITLGVNITRSGDLIRNKYDEMTRYDSLNKRRINGIDKYYIPITNLSLEVASFTLDGPDDDKSRVYTTIINMRKDLCQFFPFRLPTLEYHVEDEKEFYVTVKTPAALRNYFVDRLNLDGYLEDADHKPKVILAQIPDGALRPGDIDSRIELFTSSYIQYRPHLSLILCERKDSLRSSCKKWTERGEKICGQEYWWE